MLITNVVAKPRFVRKKLHLYFEALAQNHRSGTQCRRSFYLHRAHTTNYFFSHVYGARRRKKNTVQPMRYFLQTVPPTKHRTVFRVHIDHVVYSDSVVRFQHCISRHFFQQLQRSADGDIV